MDVSLSRDGALPALGCPRPCKPDEEDKGSMARSCWRRRDQGRAVR